MPISDHRLKEAFKLLHAKSNKVFVHLLTEKIGEAVVKTKTDQAVVESVTDLTGDEKERLKRVVEKLLLRKLQFSFAIKRQHYGGFKVIVGDWILDATIAGKLAGLRGYLVGKE